MTVGTIMTRDPVTVRQTDTVGEAIKLLLGHHYILLPVVDATGRYRGAFDVWDLLGMLLPKAATLDHLVPNLQFMPDDLPGLHAKMAHFSGQALQQHARSDLPTLAPDTPIVASLLLFYRQRSALPVVETATGKVAGVLSYWDALAAISGRD